MTELILWRFAQYLQASSGNSTKSWSSLKPESRQRWAVKAHHHANHVLPSYGLRLTKVRK